MLKGSLRGLERTSEGLGRPQCTRVPWGAYRVPLGYRQCGGGLGAKGVPGDAGKCPRDPKGAWGSACGVDVVYLWGALT